MAARAFSEMVIGFDARETFLDPGALWPPARRKAHLLRADVAWPLSVDAVAWPSVLRELPLPDCGPVAADLWDDLDELRAAVAERRAPAHRIVAVSWLTDDPLAKGGPRRAPRDAMPCALGREWELLGHDVADASCVSALSGAPYSDFQRADLAPIWGPKLNGSHLLVDPEDAFLFRALSDRRVSERAPFFVFALRALRA